MEALFQFVMAPVMITADRRFLDGPVHPLDLAVGPGMLHFGQPVLNAVFEAYPVKGVISAKISLPRLVN
jgi:hypothetical protein